MRIAWLLALLLFSPGCLASREPLGPPGALDKSLVGLWLCQEDANNNSYVHIMLEPNGQSMRLIQVNEPLTEYGGLPGAEQLTFTPARVGEASYASLSVPDYGFVFARYAVGDDRLRVAFMNFEFLEQAVQSGRLHGKAWTNTREAHVRLEDSTEDLRRFVETAGPELWEPAREYRRVAIPPVSIEDQV